jgi:hypothetical protein
MALTERTEEDKIEVVGPYKIIQVRTATIVERDGMELTRAFHRKALAPDADVSGESAEVQAIASAVWTQEIKDAYNDTADKLSYR